MYRLIKGKNFKELREDNKEIYANSLKISIIFHSFILFNFVKGYKFTKQIPDFLSFEKRNERYQIAFYKMICKQVFEPVLETTN